MMARALTVTVLASGFVLGCIGVSFEILTLFVLVVVLGWRHASSSIGSFVVTRGGVSSLGVSDDGLFLV